MTKMQPYATNMQPRPRLRSPVQMMRSDLDVLDLAKHQQNQKGQRRRIEILILSPIRWIFLWMNQIWRGKVSCERLVHSKRHNLCSINHGNFTQLNFDHGKVVFPQWYVANQMWVGGDASVMQSHESRRMDTIPTGNNFKSFNCPQTLSNNIVII